jgi:hypothetical protein
MTAAPNPARLAEIRSLAAQSTPNPDVATGLTAIEAVAYVAEEPISERPSCTDPLLAKFLSMWAEDLAAADRNTLLLPLIPALVGAHHRLPNHFAALALSWLLRGPLIDWLDAAELADEVSNIEVFPAPTTPSALAQWAVDLEEMRARIGRLSVTRTGKTGASHQLVDHVFRTRHETAEAAAAEIIKEAFGDDSVEATISELAVSACQLGMVLAAQAALDRFDAEGHPVPLAEAIKDFRERQSEQRQSAISLVRRMFAPQISA